MNDDEVTRLDDLLERFRREWMAGVRQAARDASGGRAGRGAFRVLEALVGRGERSPSELAEDVGVRTSTMTTHLDRLEEWGWAQRHADPGHGARVRVAATEQGRDAYQRFVAGRHAVLRHLLEAVPPDGRHAWAEALTAWAEHRRTAGVPS
ncbi:MAG: MarR family transcriptional regulator [Thermaerobacter sp.]|nr:MarR family transcriptional regulator [Thermaerobacter sp.]